MSIRLHFWGAAQTVTGSSHHLECAGQNILLDCGMFQGHRQEARDINEHLALPADQVNAVVLSHAHIDHSGDLPLLVKQGYRGPIYTTPSTVDLCEKMLKDSAHIQESDAEFVNRRMHRRRSIGIPPGQDAVLPLYTQADAEQTMQQFKPVTLHTPQLLAGSTVDAGFTSTTFDAGHMLGSTCVMIEAREKGQATKLLFSGDVGRKGLADYQRPGEGPAGGLSDHGEHVWEPAAPAHRAGEEQAGEPGEPDGAAWRAHRDAGVCSGADAAGRAPAP